MPRFSFEKPLIPEEKPEEERRGEGETEKTKEIDPELVEKLEKSKLKIDDKVNLLLTKAGLKPASEITLDAKIEDEEGIRELISEEEVQKAVEAIKQADLPCVIGEKETVEEEYEIEIQPGVKRTRKRERLNILVGRTQEDLNALLEAEKSGDDEQIGKAFGFPATAIEAFVGKRKKLDISKLPKEIRESDALLFSSPTLSEDNWQEEVKQGQKYADFIRKQSPKIYNEMREIALKSRGEKEHTKEEKLSLIKKSIEAEEGIKDTIALLEALADLHITQSCGGHEEGKEPEGHESSYVPWIDIEPHYPPQENWEKDERVRELVEKEARQYREKTRELIDKFYKERKIPSDVKIDLRNKDDDRGFRLQSRGTEKLGELPRKEREEKRKIYTKEMQEFTNFLREQYFSEENKNKINDFRRFLTTQILLPKEEWNERFVQYVKEKSQEEEPEPQTPEEEKQQVFERYLKALDFKIDDLEDKRVLDIGSGIRSEFVQECLDRGITQHIYGLDKRILPEKVEEKYRLNLIRGDYTQEFPVKNLDYVISHAALLKPSSETKKAIQNALSALKKGGEIRIYPIVLGPKETVVKHYGYTPEEWQKLIEGLGKEFGFSYKLRPIDIVIEEDKKPVLYQTLVVQK